MAESVATNWWVREADTPVASTTSGPQESGAAFAAVVGFTFIILLSPQNWIPALAPLRIAFLVGIFGILALLQGRWVGGRPLLNLTAEMWIAGLLLGWGIVTIPLSYWVGGSIDVLLDLYIKALIVFWLLASVVTTADRLHWLARAVMVFTVPLAMTGLKNFATGAFMDVGHPTITRITGYKSGLAQNPNDLALTLNLLLPLGIAVFLGAERATMRIFCGFVLVLNVVAVIVTFSRAGFLALATMFGLYVLRLMRRPGPDRGWACALALVALLGLPFLPSSYATRLATITDIEADNTRSAQVRLQDTIAAAKFVAEHPIVGAGLGMDILALNEMRGQRWKQIHNAYLQYAVDLGLPGLFLFLLLFWTTLRAARAARRSAIERPGERTLLLLTEAVNISLIIFGVAALFHPVAYHFYFYYMAGLALGARSAAQAAAKARQITDIS